ncbi:uncharacterized protein CLUP02_00938 [Colletotrichum lupini]|uniref:Uncharacterized protein n=1 Tax=Colletotrichum lupini TaxID=145971 RepID=A0A9Q8SC37_9PEZI|nr:uncharacterized protein CLUP02_00938 [Colletotrichum lupini]UQC74290.1 hypothetical protein CLUP02_00938 [Colletotrichum lupini]
MRNRLSLQAWVESIQTAAQADDQEWRRRLAKMGNEFAQDTLSRNGYDEGSRLTLLNTVYWISTKVFLVLREHLGDENLDLAGGVLYELIEIDCQYSDDSGAEFQRWKHDHLNRHLVSCGGASSIRIDILPDFQTITHRPGPNPKELHEMQWQLGTERAGRFIKEEEVIPATSIHQGTGTRDLNVSPDDDDIPVDRSDLRRSLSLLRALRKRRDTLMSLDGGGPAPRSKRLSWFTNMFGLETVLSFRESPDPKPVPLPEGCVAPHAIFARKFSLIADNQPLPLSMSHEMMPTADIKARKLLVDAAVQGVFVDHAAAPSRAIRLLSHETNDVPRRQSDVSSPRQIRTPKSQRGHDWFGLDTITPEPDIRRQSPHARSIGVERSPSIGYGDSMKRDCKYHPLCSSNWFGLDGIADDDVGTSPSDRDRARCKSVVRTACGVAAKSGGLQAPTNFRSNSQTIRSPARHFGKWQDSHAGGECGVPDDRWLVADKPRIHPVTIVEIETHKLRLAPSVDQLRGPTVPTKLAVLSKTCNPPDHDGGRKIATEDMLGKARELTITKQQPVLRDVGRGSRSSGMDSGDRSEKLSCSRTSSRPSSSEGQDAMRSTRHQPSLSAFYAYVEHDGSPSGSNNGSQVDIGVVPGSRASCSDYQAEDIWVGQGKTRPSSSLEESAVLEPLARLGTQPLEQFFLHQRPALDLAAHSVDLEAIFPQRDPSSYRSRIEAWIRELRTSQFEDPELVGPFPRLVLRRSRSLLLPIDRRTGPDFREDSFRSRVGNLIETKRQRKSRSVGSRFSDRRHTRETTSTTSTDLPIMTQDSEIPGGKGRVAVPSAIKGSFIPVSPKKHRSPSPQKHKPNKSVQINLNLTENQMDRLTDVTSESPSRRSRVDNFSRPRSPERHMDFAEAFTEPQSLPRGHGNPHHQKSTNKAKFCRKPLEDGHESDSTTFSELMPSSPPKGHKAKGSLASSLAERRQQHTPKPVNVQDSRQYGSIVENSGGMPSVRPPMTPDSPSSAGTVQAESSSIYSQSEGHPSPLRIHRDDIPRHIKHVLESYSGWKDSKAPALVPDTSGRGGSVQGRGPPKGRLEALKQPVMDASDIYSPLQPYFAYKELPVQRIAGKTLIGEQGWLERPDNTPDRRRKDGSPKKPGLLDYLKKIAKEMTESKTTRKPRDMEREAKVQRVTISLDPREQSLLCCELEFHISNALHAYITNELNHGRLNPDKLKKIADGWTQKGRPRVVGFRYDLETQLDLVHLHIDEFQFFGRRQGNPMEIAGLLHAMKINARSLRIRTYCQPDSVIAKQLVDSQSLCNTIGCSEAQQIAIAEIAQFFKVIVEREQAYRAKLDRDNTAQTLPHGQGDRPWIPSRELIEGTDPYGGLHLIPDGYDVGKETLRYNN